MIRLKFSFKNIKKLNSKAQFLNAYQLFNHVIDDCIAKIIQLLNLQKKQTKFPDYVFLTII